MGGQYKFSEEIRDFIKNNAWGISSKALTNLINTKFNKNFTETQVAAYKHRNKIKCGVNIGSFQKGHKDFTKNHIAHNKLPVGSERLNNNFIDIKIAQPDVWVRKHRYIWEQAYGKIPKGHLIIFLNNDKKDIRLENLALISRTEQGLINLKRRKFSDADMTKLSILTTRLEIELSKKQDSRHFKNPTIKKVEKLLNKGLSKEQIANKLNISVKTVKTYIDTFKRLKRYEENLKK